MENLKEKIMDMSAGALVFWLKARLRLRGIHDWDSQMFLAQKITGSSFLRLDKEDFKELGLPLGVQIALRSLVEDIETSEQKRSLEDREREKKKRMHVEFKTFGSAAMKTASQKIPRDLDEYSDPKKMHWLPFLSSHSHKTNRFHFNADGEFRYVGRATFKKFAEEVLALNRNKSSLFLHGHMGVGKSHMMAALACFLTRIGKLVVYISDYSAFLSDPVTATKIALARAFWNRECELDKIFEMRTVDELKTYCMQISHRERIYLLIDYQAIFDVMPPGKNGAVQAQKSSTATILLNSLTDHDGFKVECVSGNYWHRLLFSHEEAYGKTFSMYDGLDEVEMRWWWKNEGGKLHDILKMCDRKELEQWSGRIPLLLRFAADIDILDVYKNVRTSSTDLSRSPPTSHVELMQALDAQNYPLFLTAWYNALWCCEGIKKIQWQITTFIADTLKACNNDLERKKIRLTILACINGHAVPDHGEQSIDWRFCFVSNKNVGRVASQMMCMCYSHEASSYEETATTPLILRSSCTDAITASSKHTSVLEFQLKEMIISCIEAGGCKPAGENFDSIPSDVHIYSEEPVFQYDTVGFVVYSPATGNNKYVDLIMTSGDDDTTQVEIVGVHIALSPKHKETEASFFDTIDDWSDEWGNEDAKRKFVWILETIPPQKKRVEHVEASLGPGGEVLSPEYDIVYATIEEVSGITDEKLELIRWRADD